MANKRHTLISHDYDADSHVYIVTIGTDMGQFTGAAMCQPEDYQYETKYTGWELAELKAEIEYARAKRNDYNAQTESLLRFWRDMSKTRTFDPNAYWVKQLKRRVDDLDKARNTWHDRVLALKELYRRKVVINDEMNKRLEVYKNDKSN